MIEITQKVMDLPGAKYFVKLPIVGVDCEPDYYEVITQPMCFNTVIEKIRNGSYTTIKYWVKDIELIAKNCAKYNSDIAFLTFLINHLIKMFKKYARDLIITTAEGFCEETARLRTKIGQLLDESPSQFKLGNPATSKINIRQLPSEKELISIQCAMDLLTEKADKEAVRALVKQMQPDLIKEDTNKIELIELQSDTVRELRNLLTTFLRKQGLAYPY